MQDANIECNVFFVDILLIMLITGFAFGLSYHPYFFGDELIGKRLAIQYNYSFVSIYQRMNMYKPRLLFDGIDALLAKSQVSRQVHAMLVAGCMTWINILLYGALRYFFKADRILVWLIIATVLTSRFGMMFYFDYISGLIELLSSALLLSVLMMVYLACHQNFKLWYATGALLLSILTVFVHERYGLGLLAVGFAVAITECVGITAKRRVYVIAWALCLGVVPLFLFWVANKTLGALPITTGTAGQLVSLGWDTFWCMLTYSYNVFLGGNYGHELFWGHYNYLHPVGNYMGWATAICTVIMTATIILQKGFVRINQWLGLSLIGVVIALITIASLVGSARQEARFMFPVGILIIIIWVIMLKDRWRYVAVFIILVTNVMYLLLDSHDYIANVY